MAWRNDKTTLQAQADIRSQVPPTGAAYDPPDASTYVDAYHAWHPYGTSLRLTLHRAGAHGRRAHACASPASSASPQCTYVPPTYVRHPTDSQDRRRHTRKATCRHRRELGHAWSQPAAASSPMNCRMSGMTWLPGKRPSCPAATAISSNCMAPPPSQRPAGRGAAWPCCRCWCCSPGGWAGASCSACDCWSSPGSWAAHACPAARSGADAGAAACCAALAAAGSSPGWGMGPSGILPTVASPPSASTCSGSAFTAVWACKEPKGEEHKCLGTRASGACGWRGNAPPAVHTCLQCRCGGCRQTGRCQGTGMPALLGQGMRVGAHHVAHVRDGKGHRLVGVVPKLHGRGVVPRHNDAAGRQAAGLGGGVTLEVGGLVCVGVGVGMGVGMGVGVRVGVGGC